MTSKAIIQEIASNPKTGATVASSTIATGIGEILDIIPDDIGKLGVLIGMILSIALICNTIISYRKTQIEIKILKKQNSELLDKDDK